MESRWYLAPGQTIENTKISDRTHALHVSASEWKKITGQLDRKKMIAEAIEQDRAHKQALKDGSDAMTKNWPNSIQYQHIRKEQERKKRTEELEQQRRENYSVLQKEQEEIRDEFIKKVKRRMFYAKSYPKELNSALMQSEVLYERQKQLEFQKMIDAHNGEVEREYVESVKQATADYEQERQDKTAQIMQKKLELKETFLKSIEEKETLARNKRERQMREEQEDNMMAQAELELQQQMQREDEIRERAECKKEQLDFLEKTRETRKMLMKEDDEVDQVMKVFERVKHDIECMRQEKIAELRQKEQTKRVDMTRNFSKMLGAEATAKEDGIARYLQRGEQDREEMEDEKEKARLDKQRQLRKENEEDWRQCLQRKEAEERRAQEMRKWEMLNRLKCDEVARQYDEDKRKQVFEEKLKYRKMLDEHMEGIKQYEEYGDNPKKIAHEFMMKKMKQEDDEFFDYANELIEYAKKNDRPIYPIVKVVEKYKKENHIIDDEDKNGRKNCEPSPQDRMLNTSPGKRHHDPRTDPNYRRCPCHKDEIIK